MSTKPRIADYGLIGNTRTAALVSKYGSIDWCCFPRFDSPSFFAAILDSRKGGHMSIAPRGSYSSAQSYVPDTNVLQTEFATANGKVRILDCFTVDSESNKRGELWPYHEILRVVEGVAGEVDMLAELKPGPNFGQGKFRMRKARGFGVRCEFGAEIIFLKYDLSGQGVLIEEQGTVARALFRVKRGEKKVFSLTYSAMAPAVVPPLGVSALDRLERTKNYWKQWVSQCQYKGPYLEEVKRSALALKLMIYAPSGAVLAAPTASLPEEIGGHRNWDYRYCWLRDASLTIRSLVQLGLLDEARAYLGWILHSTALTRPRLQVVYTIYGGSRIPEKEISWLEGYRKSKPVRIGNAADRQFQLDVYGEVLNAVFIFAPYLKDFDQDTISFLKGLGDAVCELWQQPDEGIWEIRSTPLHHTHSKAMAWVALDRLIKLAEKHQWKFPLDKYQRVAQQIKTDIEERCYNPNLRSYVRAYDDDQLDAALLLFPIFEYDANKKRLQQSVNAIRQKLTRDGLTFRYLHGQDGVSGVEGAFAACSFWLVESLALLGKKQDARSLMEELLKKENQLGLWPEELDPDSNEYLGNYPQAFTHTALIGAALALQEVAA